MVGIICTQNAILIAKNAVENRTFCLHQDARRYFAELLLSFPNVYSEAVI